MENQITTQSIHSRQTSKVMASMGSLLDFMTDSPYARLRDEPGVFDFALGNPHEMPLEGLTTAFQKWSVPHNKDWFAYKMSEPDSQQLVGRRAGAPAGGALRAGRHLHDQRRLCRDHRGGRARSPTPATRSSISARPGSSTTR